MLKGTMKANGLAVMEIIQASFLAGSANPRMRARIAFVHSESGATLGSTEHENWSKNTLQALATLRASMEADVADLYFTSGSAVDSTDGGTTSTAPQGIADHLGTGDASQL